MSFKSATPGVRVDPTKFFLILHLFKKTIFKNSVLHRLIPKQQIITRLILLATLLLPLLDPLQPSLPLINCPLLPLNILEHELILGERHIVRKHLRVLLIKLINLRQPGHTFMQLILSLHKLAYIVINQEILEHRHHVGVLVVDYVVDHFDVIEVFVRHVQGVLTQVLLHEPREEVCLLAHWEAELAVFA